MRIRKDIFEWDSVLYDILYLLRCAPQLVKPFDMRLIDALCYCVRCTTQHIYCIPFITTSPSDVLPDMQCMYVCVRHRLHPCNTVDVERKKPFATTTSSSSSDLPSYWPTGGLIDLVDHHPLNCASTSIYSLFIITKYFIVACRTPLRCSAPSSTACELNRNWGCPPPPPLSGLLFSKSCAFVVVVRCGVHVDSGICLHVLHRSFE